MMVCHQEGGPIYLPFVNVAYSSPVCYDLGPSYTDVRLLGHGEEKSEGGSKGCWISNLLEIIWPVLKELEKAGRGVNDSGCPRLFFAPLGSEAAVIRA